MYNRYIPQSDGSFRKNRIPESKQDCTRNQPQQRKQNPCSPTVVPPTTPPICTKPAPVKSAQHAAGFLRQLLPQGLDTGDLLIGVLLLLMAGDCQEDKNTALLTLALYLFL